MWPSAFRGKTLKEKRKQFYIVPCGLCSPALYQALPSPCNGFFQTSVTLRSSLPNRLKRGTSQTEDIALAWFFCPLADQRFPLLLQPTSKRTTTSLVYEWHYASRKEIQCGERILKKSKVQHQCPLWATVYIPSVNYGRLSDGFDCTVQRRVHIFTHQLLCMKLSYL